MSAAVSLSYVAAMQEHGIPVTYAYISDAHDAHPNGPAYGPGEAGYVAALKAYDDAFATFFTRLANDGINQRNTLFVFTADEGDHFAGGTSTSRLRRRQRRPARTATSTVRARRCRPARPTTSAS